MMMATVVSLLPYAVVLCIVVVAAPQQVISPTTTRQQQQQTSHSSLLPSIVFILTDDQDIHLGGMEPMPKTRKLLGDGGARATHWYIHTPVCCPSRAETLTGRYFHNLKVDRVHVDLSVVNTTRSSGGCGNNNGCMCVDDDKVNNVTFAASLAKVGYKVGMFGKYLNSWSGKIQPGFSRWFANGGGAYFNTSFNDDRSPTGHFVANASFYAGYQTSILGNVSIDWIREIVTKNHTAGAGYTHPPFFAYIGVHAPHLPSSPAPWYAKNTFTDASLASRYKTPNFNYSATDHHWCVAQQPPITGEQLEGIDSLFRDRWRTLLSVDDLVEGVVKAVMDLHIDDHTYFFYSSDRKFSSGRLFVSAHVCIHAEATSRASFRWLQPGPVPANWQQATLI
jgi:N-acetylglucosamine-6-sulfatase